MEQITIQFQADKNLVQETSEICEELGLDLNTAINMFLSKLKTVRGIPFAVKLSDTNITHRQALDAFYAMREQVSDLPEMSLDEINAEIASAREEIKARRNKDVRSRSD